MRGNHRGIFAASHSNLSFVVGIEVELALFSSILFTSILISVLMAIPAKSMLNSAATDWARDAAVFVADWKTLRAFCFNASQTRS